MKKHVFELSLDAISEKDAEAKMTALTTLATKLSTPELSKLAHMVKHDPVKTAMAKKYLGV